MMKHKTIIAGAVALVFGPGAAVADDDEIPFETAHIFFELNDTDGELGIHSKFDGGPWTHLEIEGPNERAIMHLRTSGRLRRQGLTELFFESAEPPFTELNPQDFFRRFPQGTYEVEGRSQDGKELESEVAVTHTMPAPPVPTVNGEPMATVCDDEDPAYNATETNAPVSIEWEEVTTSHPDPAGGGAGVQPPIPITIHNYEVVLEVELEVEGEEFVSVLSVVLPPDETAMTVPAEFLALGDTFKYEVLAREASFNQTAVESCFELVN